MTVTIDVGSTCIDRAWSIVAGNTYIDVSNSANGTGTLNTFDIWFTTSSGAGGGVVVGTFSYSAPNHTSRDSETIGVVAAGSKQTFTGLSCDVTTGDFVGIYFTNGNLEASNSGGTVVYYKSGNQFGAGAQSYSFYNGYAMSLYGTCTVEGWANISEVFGVAAANISEVCGIAVANISEITGIAV